MEGLIDKINGVDICGVRFSLYIVRADLGYYMKTTDIENGSDIERCQLHASCVGDHYVGHINDSFYIIKDTSYRRVTDLSTGSGSECKEIRPEYQHGDYYFSVRGKFYIIFKDKKICRKTTKLTSPDYQEFELNKTLSDGLFYWGRKLHFFMMKKDLTWVAKYISGFNFNSVHDGSSACVHSDIWNFLPGGLSVNKVEPTGKWLFVKKIDNDRDTTLIWENIISRKVGYSKEMISEVTQNWKETSEVKFNLGAKIVKANFGYSVETGGSQVNTEKVKWVEETEEEEHMKLEIQPFKSLLQFQYVVGIGEKPMLFCGETKFREIPYTPNDFQMKYDEQ